jgi:hypothetical protein
VQIDDQPFQVASKHERPAFQAVDVTLTDQFGHRYSQTQGAEQQTVLSFEPLAGPARQVGGRLTLHVSRIERFAPDPTGPHGLRVTDVAGDWSLHFSVIEGLALSVPPPAPVRLPEATCTFTSIRVSGRFVDLRASLSGPILQTLRRLDEAQHAADQSSSSKGGPLSPRQQQMLDTYAAYALPQMLTSSGQEVDYVDSGGTATTATRYDLVLHVAVPGPGRYLVSCGTAFSKAAQRAITIA